MSGRINGRSFVLAGAVLLGTIGTAQAFAPPGTTPSVLGGVRLIIAATILLAASAVTGQLTRGAGWPVWSVLAAGGSVALFQITFFTAVSLTGVAVGSVVAIGTAPIAASVLGFLFRSEKPTPRWAVTTLVALAGCALLAVDADARANAAGILWAVGAGVAAAGTLVAGKTLLDRHAALPVTAVTFTVGGLLLLPVVIAGDTSWLAEPSGLAVALYLGLVASGIAFLLLLHGLATTPVTDTVTLNLAEPLTAALLGVVVLGEVLTPTALVGLLLVAAGLVGLTKGPRGAPTPGDDADAAWTDAQWRDEPIEAGRW